jgi:hypothetical protein
MTQSQSPLSQQGSARGVSPTAWFATSMIGIRTVAFSLLVDRALSA